jgi:DNA-binding NarL/FixJ family response regulator
MSASATAAAPAAREFRASAGPTSPTVGAHLQRADGGTPPSVVALRVPRIFAIDRRPLLRSGLAGLARRALACGTHAAEDIEGVAAALAEGASPPRAVLLGLCPGEDPERLVHRARVLGAPVICVLDLSERPLIRAALRADADGYLLLDMADAETLRATVDAVERGLRVIPPELEAYRTAPSGETTVTLRCLEVLRSLAEGLHDDEIADHLGISTSSVRKHIASAQERLRARTRTQAIAIVTRSGLL